jgi:predicted RNA binding protein YcfA (HicA-like mRNA interferase family)
MAFSSNAWKQLKGCSADDLIAALKKDGWTQDPSSKGAVLGFVKGSGNPDRKRITIHYHPQKTYGPGLLKALIRDIGWSESDMKKLKLIR